MLCSAVWCGAVHGAVWCGAVWCSAVPGCATVMLCCAVLMCVCVVVCMRGARCWWCCVVSCGCQCHNAFVCLFVCLFTDSRSCRSITLLREEPVLPCRLPRLPGALRQLTVEVSASPGPHCQQAGHIPINALNGRQMWPFLCASY